MRFSLLLLSALAGFGLSSAQGDDLHEPAKASPERKAIMDAIRASQIPKQDVVFVVNYLRVHQDWAWTDVSPKDGHGKAVAEGGTVLLHRKAGAWLTVDLSKVPEDPQNPMGAEEASPGFIKNLRTIHPEIPVDIFPKAKK